MASGLQHLDSPVNSPQTHGARPAWTCQHRGSSSWGRAQFHPHFSFSPTWVSRLEACPTPRHVGTQTPGRREPETQGHGLYLEVPSWARAADMMPRGEAGGNVRVGMCHNKAQGPPRPCRPVSVHACGVVHCVRVCVLCCMWYVSQAGGKGAQGL